MFAVRRADMIAFDGTAKPVFWSTVNPPGGVTESIQPWLVLRLVISRFCWIVNERYVFGGYTFASATKLPYTGANEGPLYGVRAL